MTTLTAGSGSDSGRSRPAARRPVIVIGLAAAVLLLAAAGPELVANDPLAQSLELRNAGPSAAHPLGVDPLGRDMAARLAAGTRLSLAIALAGSAVALLLGAGVGLVAAVAGGWLRSVLMGLVDLVRTMPGVLLALVLMVALGNGAAPVILALGLAFAPIFALVAAATYRREMAAGYVQAALVLGSGRFALLRRHVLPNIVGALVTQAALVVPRAITTESVLSFLGLGVAPETPTWGRMIADGVPYIETAPHAALVPMMALSLVTVVCVLAGDRLRATLDPLRDTGTPRP
ncbi:amino acid ABC transporter permease [Allostella sp. ATCC 35155]|nr:amino acid ABC transporter permease [Stella sp. ATCC 35155]